MRLCSFTLCGLVVLGVAGAAEADDWRAARVWMAGNDSAVWVVGESAAPADHLPVLQMWFAGGKTGRDSKPKQSDTLPPVVGRPLIMGADAEALRILYSDLSAYDYFGDQPSSVGAVWREQCGDCPPLAWAGDAAEPTFWALVETESLRPPASEPASTDATEDEGRTHGVAPREAEDGDEPPAVPAERAGATPAGRLTLLQLRDGVWQRLSAPPQAFDGQRFWLAARAGTLHLFWIPAERRLWCATRTGTAWGGAEVAAAELEPLAGWAGAGPEGPIFVAGIENGSGQAMLRLFSRRDGAWSDMGIAREGNEALLFSPATAAIAVVSGQLGIARPTAQGDVEFGLGDLGPTPSIRFATLALEGTAPPERPFWQDALLLGVMMLVLTGVFWSRRERLALRAALPPGMRLAAVYRRVLAAVLDFLPAVMVAIASTAPWMLPELLEPNLNPELPEAIAPARYGSIVLYGLWCMIWELATGATPGKMLFGCRVLGINGAPPLTRQIVVRNAARVLELLAWPLLLLTLMSMGVLTRNRQRIGDLLADTMVVEPGERPKGAEEEGSGD